MNVIKTKSRIHISKIQKIWDLRVNDTYENATLTSSSDEYFRTLVFTYWNDYLLKEQDAWIDDIILTTVRPESRDAEGHYMI